ncbi:MAG TPA: hypothetical protein P5256_03920 [Beijerinckiaceae bacterium]|nr:hypothetical protein [Methylobacteriaceae bacterium]HPG03908.1 hypothetical protein [Rhodoblastus sp.]HRY02248.1 hypothetical protein [Beijerinckiaceae bacterium]
MAQALPRLRLAGGARLVPRDSRAMGDGAAPDNGRRHEPDLRRRNARPAAAVALEQKGHHAAVVGARLETFASREAEACKAGKRENDGFEWAARNLAARGNVGRFTARSKPTHDATPRNANVRAKRAAIKNCLVINLAHRSLEWPCSSNTNIAPRQAAAHGLVAESEASANYVRSATGI